MAETLRPIGPAGSITGWTTHPGGNAYAAIDDDPDSPDDTDYIELPDTTTDPSTLGFNLNVNPPTVTPTVANLNIRFDNGSSDHGLIISSIIVRDHNGLFIAALIGGTFDTYLYTGSTPVTKQIWLPVYASNSFDFSTAQMGLSFGFRTGETHASLRIYALEFNLDTYGGGGGQYGMDASFFMHLCGYP